MAICILIEKDGKPNWCERHKTHHRGHYAQYAIDEGEKGQKFRRLWDRQLLSTSITTKARSYISTLSQHVLNGSKTVPDEIREQRQAICNGCDKRDPVKNACKVCGCKLEKTFLGDKLAWAVSSCPLGKWQAYHENPLASGGISGVENPNISFGNSMTESNNLLPTAIRFDHENLHPQVIPGLRFNSTIIEQA